MARFAKTYTSPLQSVALLRSRGLVVADDAQAERCLRHVGYYRFSAYLYPLLEAPKAMHVFKPGATFAQAWEMYRFDRQLRLLMFAQIGEIEIAVRSAIVNIASRETGTPFWMTDPAWFGDGAQFAKTLQVIDAELAKSREDFIGHFRRAYDEPYPPAWMLAEILPLGVLTRIYTNLRSSRIRKLIAQEFCLSAPVFTSWMTIVTVARNSCCHHARVWNRTFALRALTMRRMERPWISEPVDQQKVFFSLCVIKHFLDIISPQNDMTAQLLALLSSHPTIDARAMGFPAAWQEEALWQARPSR